MPIPRYYVRTDDNILINTKAICWVKKMNECLEICTRPSGCTSKINTHSICKDNSKESYETINKYFE